MTVTNINRTISQYLTVVKIRIKTQQPRNAVMSKKARAELAKSNGIDENNLSVAQRLHSDSQLRKDIGTYAPKIKLAIMPFTVAVVDGWHWVPVQHFDSVRKILDFMTGEYNSLIEKFATNLADLIEADRKAKGDLFDVSAYETAEEIRGKRASWTFDVDNHNRKFDQLFDDKTLENEMKQSWEKQQKESLKGVDQQLIGRIVAETIFTGEKSDSILTRLARWETATNAGKRTSLHTDPIKAKIESAADLTRLCISGCPDIASVGKSLRSILINTDFDGLKEDAIRNPFKARLIKALSSVAVQKPLPTTIAPQLPVIAQPIAPQQSEMAPVAPVSPPMQSGQESFNLDEVLF